MKEEAERKENLSVLGNKRERDRERERFNHNNNTLIS